ncbi:MAG: 4Fe-4S dicluster domain-containing protein [Deltaproteobacteria bacterium]|nr:4Fe-4S dicluster domain-containing protein [Deltaproteobacteria bacterium]
MIKRSFFGFARPSLSYEAIPETQPEPVVVVPREKIVLFIPAPCAGDAEGCAKPGDEVAAGEKIVADGNDAVYAISPVAGTITEMTGFDGIKGNRMTAVSIDVSKDSDSKTDDGFKTYGQSPTLETAATYFGFLPGKPDFTPFTQPGRKIKSIVVMGVDRDLKCITNQHVIKTAIVSVKTGIEVLRKITGIQDVILVVPENLLQVAGSAGASIKAAGSQYPTAHPELLLKRLGADESLEPESSVFFTAESVAALGVAYNTGRIPSTKLVTVVKKDGSLRLVSAPIGTRFSDILATVAQMPSSGDRVVSGGPLTGEAVYTLDYPVMPDTDTIVVQNSGDIVHVSDTPCDNCGECIRVCPVNVPVSMLVRYIEAGEYETAEEKMDLMACIECGFCSYVCESRIPIFQYIRLAKHAVAGMNSAEE